MYMVILLQKWMTQSQSMFIVNWVTIHEAKKVGPVG